MTQRIRATVSGAVQGVFFRASCQREAQKLDLTGWVRNRPGGDVELEAQGELADVDRLIEWCRRGPPDAEVARVASEVIARVPGEGVFEIRR